MLDTTTEEVFNVSSSIGRAFDNWALFIAILGGIMVGIYKTYNRIKPHFTKSDNFSTVHTEIHELLTELRLCTDSARTQVLQFHNGEYFMDGITMRKFSVTHESLVRGIDSCVGKMTGSLCSLFVPLLSLVLNNSATILYVTDLKDSYFKQFFESRNIEAFMVLPLSVKNQITGFVIVQWCNSIKIDRVDPLFADHHMQKIRNNIQVQLSQQKK